MKRKLMSPGLVKSIAALEAAVSVGRARASAPEDFDPQAAATTIDSYSTERAQVNPPLYAPLKPNQMEGRVRIATFTKVYATEAAGEDTALCVLPKGARIITGIAQVSATTGSATLAFGLMGKNLNGLIDDTVGATVSDNVAALKAAAAITTTAQVQLAATVALSSNYEAAKELYVTVTTAAASMAAQTLSGYIMYVVD